MITVKMKIQGMYNGQTFKKGDSLALSENEVKGLDANDYTVVSQNSENEKVVKKSSNKMQNAEDTK